MTTTIKIGKDTITNNTDTCKITKNQETIKNYCILSIGEEKSIIQQAGHIKTIQNNDPKYEEYITIFKETTTKNKNKSHKKTSKTTIKGKKTKDEKKE